MINISSRFHARTGDNVGIGGFILQGNAPKKVIVRGIGPSMQINGTPVPGRLADPMLELHDGSGAIILTNDNWRSSQEQEIMDSGLAPADDREAAIVITLQPGSYTGIIKGVNDTIGVALVEIFDLDDASNPAQLANLSTRAFVSTDDDVLIGGVILRGGKSGRVVFRGIGPSLKVDDTPVPGRLEDPILALHDGNGALMTSNDNWKEAPNFAEVQLSGLAPTDDRESAILTTLTPGNYTAIMRGVNRTTGIGLVEVYNIE